MMSLTLQSIHIYPIKSLEGILLSKATIDGLGLKFDRRWMLVDDENVFMTQRNTPRLNELKVSLTPSTIVVTQPDNNKTIEIPLNNHSENPLIVTIWKNTCKTYPISTEIDNWFSSFLEKPCKLVFLPEENALSVDTQYATSHEKTSFTDGFPFLIIGEESLNLLNSKLSEPMQMSRFRPNFVFSGGTPHCEDEWKTFQIGESVFKRVKPCARCVVTTIQPNTSKKGSEPLKTLATYRRQDGKIYFGQNLIHISGDTVSVGDEIKVL